MQRQIPSETPKTLREECHDLLKQQLIEKKENDAGENFKLIWKKYQASQEFKASHRGGFFACCAGADEVKRAQHIIQKKIKASVLLPEAKDKVYNLSLDFAESTVSEFKEVLCEFISFYPELLSDDERKILMAQGEISYDWLVDCMNDLAKNFFSGSADNIDNVNLQILGKLSRYASADFCNSVVEFVRTKVDASDAKPEDKVAKQFFCYHELGIHFLKLTTGQSRQNLVMFLLVNLIHEKEFGVLDELLVDHFLNLQAFEQLRYLEKYFVEENVYPSLSKSFAFLSWILLFVKDQEVVDKSEELITRFIKNYILSSEEKNVPDIHVEQVKKIISLCDYPNKYSQEDRIYLFDKIEKLSAKAVKKYPNLLAKMLEDFQKNPKSYQHLSVYLRALTNSNNPEIPYIFYEPMLNQLSECKSDDERYTTFTDIFYTFKDLNYKQATFPKLFSLLIHQAKKSKTFNDLYLQIINSLEIPVEHEQEIKKLLTDARPINNRELANLIDNKIANLNSQQTKMDVEIYTQRNKKKTSFTRDDERMWYPKFRAVFTEISLKAQTIILEQVVGLAAGSRYWHIDNNALLQLANPAQRLAILNFLSPHLLLSYNIELLDNLNEPEKVLLARKILLTILDTDKEKEHSYTSLNQMLENFCDVINSIQNTITKRFEQELTAVAQQSLPTDVIDICVNYLRMK